MKPTVLFSAGFISVKSGRVGRELSDGVGCTSAELGSDGDAALIVLRERFLVLEGDGGACSLPEDESRTTG